MSSITDLLTPNGTFGMGAAVQQVGNFVLGTVTDNSNKENAGMVKVEFTAFKNGQNIYEWIPVLHSYAGKAYGAYTMPEVGDLVLVGFIGADKKRPFVMGSFFPSDSKMVTENFASKNVNKAFRTKGGISMAISDDDKKESCVLTTPKGMTVSLEDEKEIVKISDKKGENALLFDCQKGQVTLEGKSKISIVSGKCKIELDGQGGQISISCDRLTVKAAQQANIESSQMMSVKGSMLTVEGKQTAQFKGGTMAQLSGGMVKIN